MMNRKATSGDALMLVQFIVLLILAGAGISAGILIYYGGEISFRGVEAELLAVSVEECLTEIDVKDIFADCGINKDVIERDYILEVFMCEEKLASIGDRESCFIEADNKNYPKCFSKERVIEGKKVRILAGSYQKIRRELT